LLLTKLTIYSIKFKASALQYFICFGSWKFFLWTAKINLKFK